MQGFDIYFLGELMPDAEPAQVRDGVARLFKINVTETDPLFSGRPVRVKRAVDADTASRYRAAFREVGALVQIVPEGSPKPAAKAPPPMPAAPTPASPVAAAADPAPPATSATEPAAEEPASEPGPAAPSAPDYTLAEPGAIIDHTPPAPPAEIDVSGLEALPPNTGSLDDCRVEKTHRPIPDIGHLKLVDD